MTLEKKIPLEWAATTLVAISQQIEDGADLDTLIVEAFNDAKLSVSEAIDRRKAARDYLKIMIAQCKAAKAYAMERQKFYERAEEKLIEKTKEIIEANPGIPYVDSLGSKVSVVKNGQPKLSLKLPLTASKTVTNIIDAEQAEFFGVSQAYIKPVSFLTLDTKQLKDDLENGIPCEWAALEWGSQLRGL